MELIEVADTTETKDTSSPEEEELTLAEEFTLLEKEFDAFMVRKKRLLKRLGLIDANCFRKEGCACSGSGMPDTVQQVGRKISLR
jgi:hypothetical protein